MKFFVLFICAVFIPRSIENWDRFETRLYSDYYVLCDHDKTLDLSVSEMKVYFYDFKRHFYFSRPIDTALKAITTNYNLNYTENNIIFFVPGYKSNISKNREELVRQAFQNVPDIFLIIIDHSAYTSAEKGRVANYEITVTYTYYIGKALGEFLAGIRESGYLMNIHCIGHSLGSQMLGYVGTTYTELTGEYLWRVTGIDPSGPCFNRYIESHIRAGVGDYVDVYHCNTRDLGSNAVLADTDFFFTSSPSDIVRCRLKACLRYYLDTITNKNWFLAWQCNTNENLWYGNCLSNEVTLAGYYNPGNATGIFYVSAEDYGILYR